MIDTTENTELTGNLKAATGEPISFHDGAFAGQLLAAQEKAGVVPALS